MLWSFGGMEVDKDGKTVRINSPATVQTIEWYQKMFKRLHGARGALLVGREQQRVHPAGQGGLDPQPGVRLHRGASSASWSPPTASTTTGAWAGRPARHETDTPRHIGIWKFSKNIDASKEWIRYLIGKRENYDEYIMSGDAFNLPVFEKLQDHPVLRTDPKYAALKGEGVQYHTYGWPAPPSDKVQLITNTYLLPNMIAKAVTGTSTKDSIAWAENEMKKILAG